MGWIGWNLSMGLAGIYRWDWLEFIDKIIQILIDSGCLVLSLACYAKILVFTRS